ncbi:MAG TPA: CBS domain-containing protein [Noviherbaspirillum sp.]|nr:CBS domain-containing protein [Noviherbaspirillum sp.]
MQTVSQLMTRNVQVVSPHETIRRAAQMMDELNVGALPVCDGERLVGMITDRDITVRATSAGMAPDEAHVDEVMSADVRWCYEDQPLDEVMQQMADTQIRRVPVVSHDDARRLLGIVSLGDIATKANSGNKYQDAGQLMAGVSSPSEPDRSGAHRPAPPAGRMTSDVATGAGLAGSDVLDAGMNRHGASSTGDPSDVVEVGPDDLVNRNAPDAKAVNVEQPGSARRVSETEKNGVKVRRTVADGSDTSTGESGAPAGIDSGAAGASGGGAGTSGSPGTGIGAKP